MFHKFLSRTQLHILNEDSLSYFEKSTFYVSIDIIRGTNGIIPSPDQYGHELEQNAVTSCSLCKGIALAFIVSLHYLHLVAAPAPT